MASGIHTQAAVTLYEQMTKALDERSRGVRTWTRPELVEFINKHSLAERPVENLTKDELVAIVVVNGSYEIDLMAEAQRAKDADLARVRKRKRSPWAVSS